jgi:septal ring factor EnvC (AmiA/AmiB activator)
MADPTLADVMAAIANLATAVHRVDLQNQQQTALLAALTTGVQIMSQTADQTATAVADLDAKVDALIGLVQPSIQTLRDQLAAAQAQVTALQAGDAADAATLSATIAAAQAEASKVQAAIDGLSTPAPTP